MTTVTAPLGEGRRKASTFVDSFSGAMLGRAARDAFVKLDPRKLTGNPVIFATEIVAILATASTVRLDRGMRMVARETARSPSRPLTRF